MHTFFKNPKILDREEKNSKKTKIIGNKKS